MQWQMMRGKSARLGVGCARPNGRNASSNAHHDSDDTTHLCPKLGNLIRASQRKQGATHSADLITCQLTPWSADNRTEAVSGNRAFHRAAECREIIDHESHAPNLTRDSVRTVRPDRRTQFDQHVRLAECRA